MADRFSKRVRRSKRGAETEDSLVKSTIDTAVGEAFQETAESARPPGVPETSPPPRDTVTAPAPSPAETESVPSPGTVSVPAPTQPNALPDGPLPARMLNEFVYCPRLFYYEFVEGVFVENADTLRGAAVHARVDKGSGAMPAADGAKDAMGDKDAKTERESPEIIHSRSVSLSSERLGVTAKLDLVEVRPPGPEQADLDLFGKYEVCPVDYKAGSPREGDAGNELWDTDRMQLALQCLILRDNGYTCNEGVIYYRGTKQRVRLPMTPELEAWVLERIAEARETATGPIPPPLVDSPKCPRCSLVTVCLPDETRMLGEPGSPAAENSGAARPPVCSPPPRRLIAGRDDARALYLTTPGLYVGRKDEVLQIREGKAPAKKGRKGASAANAPNADGNGGEVPEKTVQEVRIRDIAHLALFGNIQVSTAVVQALCGRDVPISYFSMGGWFYGITRGHSLKNVFLRVEQFRQAADPIQCRQLARAFVYGKIRNQRTMLMRNHVEPPGSALLRLKRAADDAVGAESLEQLLGIEGAAASVYFEHFNGLIKLVESGEEPETDASEFRLDFNGRNRRPPTDPVNAMLSLAYSLLAKDCTLAALAVGFDPYIGFYHQPRFGRPAMALDIMEEFRPLIADSTVLTAINNRMITEMDFVRAGKAVNLSAAGRRNFFQAYEQRMSQLITHPVFDYKVSYRRALELQFRILARVLTGEIDQYQPFMTR